LHHEDELGSKEMNPIVQKQIAAGKTLEQLGYTWQGGKLWELPSAQPEPVALKAQIAELMPLAKFCATLINDGYFEADDALYAGLMDGDYKFKPEIKATIDKLLKD
jgi:hypothetical protein